ncbi:FemAB family PEP-CTERM system-associated protein [Azospirillaceae bacterium]
MALQVKVLESETRPAWDRFVLDECPEASFFHRSGWRDVIERVYRQRCHYLYAERDGQIAGVLPLVHIRSPIFGNRLISTAFTIGGGSAAVDEEARAALDAESLRMVERLGVKCYEVRAPAHLHDGDGWVTKSDVYANFSRPIAASEDECLKQIPRKQRAVVRKALSGGELVDEMDDQPSRFFPLYAFSMRNMGTPVFGRRFFSTLMTVFGRDCDCLTISHQGKPVSSVMNFYFRDRVMPYYTGCLLEARDLGANDFMYWRLMRRAMERGYAVFDFGRSKFGTGPFSFKKNWGFEPQPIPHQYFVRSGGEAPEINPKNPKFKMFIAVWKRLPLGLANALGPHVIRQIG